MSELSEKILGQGLDYCPVANDEKIIKLDEWDWWDLNKNLAKINSALLEDGHVSYFIAEHRHDGRLSTEASYFRQFMGMNA